MKEIRLSAVFITVLFIAAGCAGSPAVTSMMGFDEAIAGATASVENRVKIGAEIAISKIDSPLSSLSDFLNDELSSRFSANKKLAVLARGKARERMGNEHTFQMSGMVSDESAVGIGKYLGAKVVITGTFSRYDNFSQLSIRAIEVETARVLTRYRARIANNDVILDLANVTKPLETIKPVVIQENALAHLNRGKDLYAEWKLDAAIAEFNKALAINAKLSEAFYYRGNVYSDKGDDDRAIADYTDALSIEPNDASALNNRGSAYSYNGDDDRAIADFTDALSIDPNFADAYYNRGNVYYFNGDDDRAIADFTAALSIEPNYAAALNGRGNAYGKKGDDDRAIADYTAALGIEPNYAVALNGRGNAYYNKGDSDRAIADYTAALSIEPNDAFAYYYRGHAYVMKGDLNRAISDWEAVLKINPNDTDAKEALEIARKERGY